MRGYSWSPELVSVRWLRHVDSSRGPLACWLWTGAKNGKNGYGTLYIGKRDDGRLVNSSAHRVSFQLHVGPLTSHDIVMHTCDVPSCVNPAHLRKGTPRENMQDCIAKGRHRSGKKLTTEMVATIRSAAQAGESKIEIGERLGVSEYTVDKVVRRKIWRSVP